MILRIFVTIFLLLIKSYLNFKILFIDIILTSLDDCTVSFGKLPNVILKICDFLLFNSSLINHLAARGIPTYVWVLNEEAEFKRAMEAGAAGIMTDYPSRLKLFTMKQ